MACDVRADLHELLARRPGVLGRLRPGRIVRRRRRRLGIDCGLGKTLPDFDTARGREIDQLAAFLAGLGHRIAGDRRGHRSRGVGREGPHVGVDDASRLASTEILAAGTARARAGSVARAAQGFARRRTRIERVRTDNAFAYTNSRAFRAVLAELGPRPALTRR